MSLSPLFWTPRFTLTPAIERGLAAIDAARAAVAKIPLPPAAEADLQRRARVRSTHFSTVLEGSPLSVGDIEQIVEGRVLELAGREHDVELAQNYVLALARVDQWAVKKLALTEDLVQRLHALVEGGERAKPQPYRDDPQFGSVRQDVSERMKRLVAWARQANKDQTPVPLIAAAIHHQIATISPYPQGSARTARLLTTFVLGRGGYGLNGFLSLEERHAGDLHGYEMALALPTGQDDPGEAALSVWTEYFINRLAEAFEIALDQAQHLTVRRPAP